MVSGDAAEAKAPDVRVDRFRTICYNLSHSVQVVLPLVLQLRRSAVPTTLTVKPWPDALIDTLGYDPRSRYVETFWLPTLGPPSLPIEPIRGAPPNSGEAPLGS